MHTTTKTTTFPTVPHFLRCAEACLFEIVCLVKETKDHMAKGNRAEARLSAAEARTKADVAICFWGDADERANGNRERRMVAEIKHKADLARMFAARATDLVMAD